MLSLESASYKSGLKYNKFALKKSFNAFKKSLPWMREVNAHAVINDAIDKLDRAYKGFFAGRNNRPKFHSKRNGAGSFSIAGSEVKYDAEKCRVYVSRIGWIRLSENIRFKYSRLYRVTFSSVAGQWYASFNLEVEDNRSRENQASSVGIDLGISKLATCSDGVVFQNPRVSNRFLARQRKLNKELSRRTNGGKNWWKTVAKLRKLHHRITCIRGDSIHKMTTTVSRKHGIVCLEDLNVSGMSRNRKLARHILDASFSEIRRQFEYKALTVRLASRFEPTSQLCSCCGNRQAVPLCVRIFDCFECGLQIDRDVNASINIEKLSASSVGDKKPAAKRPLRMAKSTCKLLMGRK